MVSNKKQTKKQKQLEDIAEIKKYISNFPNGMVALWDGEKTYHRIVNDTCKYRYEIYRTITDFKNDISEDITIKQLDNGRFSTTINGITYASLNQKRIFEVLDKLQFACNMVKIFKAEFNKKYKNSTHEFII